MPVHQFFRCFLQALVCIPGLVLLCPSACDALARCKPKDRTRGNEYAIGIGQVQSCERIKEHEIIHKGSRDTMILALRSGALESTMASSSPRIRLAVGT